MRNSYQDFYHSRYVSPASDDQPTVVTAVAKLKSTQDKIYEVEKRLDALHRRKIHEERRVSEQKRRSQVKEEIRNFAAEERKIKHEYLMRMSMNIDKYHEKSQRERSKHKQKLEELKDMMYTQNNWAFKAARKERIDNERQIRQEKMRQLQEKKRKWEKKSEEEKKRRLYVQEAKKKNEQRAKLHKSYEVYSIKNRLNERQQLLKTLQQKEQLEQMEVSRAKIRKNPEEILLTKESIGSMGSGNINNQADNNKK